MATVRSYTLKELLSRAEEISRDRRHGYVGISHVFLASLKLQESFTRTWLSYISMSDFVLSTSIYDEMPAWKQGDAKHPVRTKKLEALLSGFAPETAEKEIINWILHEDLNDISIYFLKKDIDTSRYADEDRGKKTVFVDIKDAQSFEHLGRLNDYSRNLTLLAMNGKLHPVIGREEEIQKIRRILLQTKKNSPVLIGDAGVGKTAVVEGFAQYLLNEETNPYLKRMKVLELDLTALMSGTKYIGETEKRVQLILKTVEDDPNVVLFIDEIHRIVGLGRTEGGINDISNMFKPALARGSIKIIGATTFKEYQQSFANDKALERRFETIAVREPDEETAFQMIRDSLSGVFEKHYGMKIEEELIRPAITLVKDYMPLKKLPDSAVSVFDRAFAASMLSGKSKVTMEDVEKAVSEMADISLIQMKSDVKNRFRYMMESLRGVVFGQEQVLEALESSIAPVILRLADRERPLGVFLFLGPTGVGKTFVARKMAEALFGSGEKYLQLDMGSYKNEHDISRLIGSPPGYVGYEEKGELTNFMKANPNAVVMFDEIEKAHPRVFDSLLGLFESGFIKDSHGDMCDGKNILFVMSSNVAVREFKIPGIKTEKAHDQAGNARSDSSVILSAIDKEEKRKLRGSLEEAGFRREFINRVDMIVRFNDINRDALGLIALREINRVRDLLNGKGIDLVIDRDCVEWIVSTAEEEKLGARPIKRLVRDYITKPVSYLVIEEERTKISVRMNEGRGNEALEIRAE